MSLPRAVLVLLSLVVVPLVVPAAARAAAPENAPDPGPAAGGLATAPLRSAATQSPSNGNCSAGALLLNVINPLSHCNVGSQTVNSLPQLPGDVAGAAGSAAQGLAGDAMDQVAGWMVQAAQTVDGDVMKAATATSTPELSAPWYQQEFGYLAFFGAALAGIVALLGVFSASARGDPYALGEIFYGILRAGLVTAMVISLTLLALKVADGISGDIAQHMPAQFFGTLSSAWGTKGWGGLASSALAFVAALVEVVIAVLLWIELLFRDAAIYVAVLFFPFTLAVAIWPRLSDTNSKLARILGVFIVFKPAALIVMLTGANLLLGGLSFDGGVAPSAGTILAGLAVLAMAAFAPWALMHLVGLEAGVMGSSSSRRGGGAGGAGGGVDGRAAGGALGGELFGGMIAYGGGAAAAVGSGRAPGPVGQVGANGGGEVSSRGGNGSAGAGGANGGDAGRRMLPGPVAAAAGLVPAGWQAAQTVAAKGQSIADHGAARVHIAAGHGGMKPQAVGVASAAGVSNGYSRGTEGPPLPTRPDAGRVTDAGISQANGDGPTGGPLHDDATNGQPPPPASGLDQLPPRPEQPLPRHGEESS
jgi:hypothetical protein